MKLAKPKFGQAIFFMGITLLVVLAGVIVFDQPTLAQQVTGFGLEVGKETGLSGTDPRIIIARVIQVGLGFLGVITLGLLVYAGFLWMTSAGEQEKVTKAKTILRNGLIGLIIIITSFGIATFILNLIGGATGISNLPGNRAGRGFVSGGGGFPFGAIEAHYPDRGQTNVARNTNIIVTFVEPLLVDSVIDDNATPEDKTDDLINTANIQILKADDDSGQGPFVPARAGISEDLRSIVLDPVDLMGSSQEHIRYKVMLGEGISTASGRPTFGAFGSYEWEFEVGTFIDLDPPIIESIYPIADSTHPRNVVIQINFNEAMNPLTAAGDVAKGFNIITVKQSDGDTVDGNFLMSNQYRTVEFITKDLCGRNSCGEDIFCLPGSSTLTAYLRAATVGLQPPTADFPYDGLTDVAANSFDGNIDGVASGSPEDDFKWSFSTTSEIDLTSPVISNVSPDPFATAVDLEAPVTARFSKPLMFKSINRESVQFDGVDYNILSSTEGDASTISLRHTPFPEESTFTPLITSGIRDLYQNCYNPCVGP